MEYLEGKTRLKTLFLFKLELHPNLWKNITDWATKHNVHAFGLNKDALVTKTEDNHINRTNTMVVDDIHAIGKKVHVYTFRNEYMHLAWDYGQDPYTEYDFFLSMNIDGYFTDFTRTARQFLKWKEEAFSKLEL